MGGAYAPGWIMSSLRDWGEAGVKFYSTGKTQGLSARRPLRLRSGSGFGRDDRVVKKVRFGFAQGRVGVEGVRVPFGLLLDFARSFGKAAGFRLAETALRLFSLRSG